ncbi:MAG: exosortase H-associated membrane protein [Usitatibacter sp.]
MSDQVVRDPSLGRFVLRTFLWLPPCFAAWYFSAHYSAAAAGALARLWVGLFNSNIVSTVEQPAMDLIFVTTLEVHPAAGQTAVVLPEVNPLLYTYGLPLFLALMLAARARWWKIAIGAVALLPFQSWGIAFDFMMQVGIQLGPEVALQAGFSARQREVIALGYQVGSLILPTLAPVAAWAIFSRHHRRRYSGSATNPTAASKIKTKDW